MNQNLLRASPIEIVTPDTTSPIICKNSANTVVCTITNTGNIVANGTISSNGNNVLTTTYSPIFCGGFVSNNGTKSTTIGRVDYTVTTSATGKYLITYNSTYPNGNNYMPTITCWNPSGSFALLGVAGPSTNNKRLEVHTFLSNALSNCYFYFMVY